MFTATLTFPLAEGGEEGILDRAQHLLACWYKNGQLVDRDWLFATKVGALEVSVLIAEPRALDESTDNVYARDARRDLGDSAPSLIAVNRDPIRETICACPRSSALVLYTNYLDVSPPVRCLDCFRSVPLYRLPHTRDHEHLELLQWASDYRACDTLQIHCPVGERFGERQLARHDSALSRLGRDIASRLELATQTPSFYYLHRSRGRRRERELARRCPSCGSGWRLDERAHIFDFRCARCRLVSNATA